jgi:hypothetical protein
MYPSYFLPSFIASHDLIEPHERFDLPSLEKKKVTPRGRNVLAAQINHVKR